MERRGVSSKTIIGIIALIAALGVLAGVYFFDKIKTENETVELRQRLAAGREAQREEEKKIVEVLTDLKSSVSEDVPGVVCWGDEYLLGTSTNNIPYFLHNVINEELFSVVNTDMETTAYLSSYSVELPVKNNGIRGEDLYTMAARTGAYPLCIADKTELPKGTDNTQVSFITKGSRPVLFMDQPSVPFGNCTLDDVEGTIELEKIADNEYKYYFSKNAASEPKTVEAKTRIYTSLSTSYPDDLLVIFFGREYSETADLVNIERRIANNREVNTDKFVVVSMTDSGSKLDSAMTAEFGDNYLRLDVPANGSLDNYETAQTIYKKLDSLGYFNSVKNDVSDAEAQINKIREG